MENRKYYEAYDERYKTVHKIGLRWFSDTQSPIVAQTIERYSIGKNSKILEIGCGEGRDAHRLLEEGFDLLATDISPTAINFCKENYAKYNKSFNVLDCINGSLEGKFDFIYAVAVVHMLLFDNDRDAFYRFINTHLKNNGIALICSMGDGDTERQTDARNAFELQERECIGKKIMVAGTSCRIVSNERFEEELLKNGLHILEMGQTGIDGQFSDMMYAVVKCR